MDRSFLSQTPVIEASRKFVCIRLTSYEDEAEKAFVRTLMTFRSGDVENTAFALLDPAGKPLTRGTRGAGQMFNDAADMAKRMDALAEKYPAKASEGIPPLPIALNARIALNVAASDLQPLVVVLANDAKKWAELEAKVSALAWDKEFLGRFTYATASDVKDLPEIDGRTITEGVLLLEPDVFGIKGKLLKEVSDPTALADAMRKALLMHVKLAKTMRSQRSAGMEAGVFYEPKLPVTDREEAQAREGYKARIQKKD